MPAASVDMKERAKRARALSAAIEKSGRSVRRAAAEVAEQREAKPATMWKNFQRWMAAQPRPGAIDAAPDWAIEAVKALPELATETMSQQLRAAIAAKHIPLALAQRAADALAAMGK